MLCHSVNLIKNTCENYMGLDEKKYKAKIK